MAVEYPIRAVARLTGLTVDTLRAWERRYSAVSPSRKGRGRSYSEDDVQRLVRLRQIVDRGHAIGQVANLNDAELEKLLEGPEIAREARYVAPERDRRSPRATPVMDAINRFDFTGVERELFRLAMLLPTRELVHEVVLPLMRAVGERWHRGELSVSQEHMASAVTRNLLGSVMRMYQPDPHSSRIVIAAPAGELHEFGILAAAILAAASRLEATYLGANLPGREVIDAATRTGANVVLIGVTNPEPADRVIDEVQLVARGLPREIPLWIGGARPDSILEDLARDGVISISNLETLELHLQELSKEGAR